MTSATLTHWGRDKMAGILRRTFSRAFSGDKPLSGPMMVYFTDAYIWVTRPQWFKTDWASVRDIHEHRYIYTAEFVKPETISISLMTFCMKSCKCLISHCKLTGGSAAVLLNAFRNHSALSLREGEPVNKKGTNGLPTSRPPSNIVCLMAETW